MGKQSTPSTDPNVGIAATKNAEVGQGWLDFSKSAYSQSMQRQAKIDDLNSSVINQELSNQATAQQWATEAHNRQKSVFEPLQDEFIAKAKNWDSAGKQAEAASAAAADVTNAVTMQRAESNRQQAAMGVNPTSGRYAGVDRAAGTEAALATAGAQNNARTTLKNQAMALQGSAINMGNGLAANASQDLGLSNSSGGAASATAMTGGQLANSATSIMGQGYSGAMRGYSNQANILNQQFNQQMQSYNASNAQTSGIMSGLGSIAGLFMLSDEDAKEDKKEVKGVLDALKEMPVEAWKYKDGTGQDPNQEHVGTYAQDFQKATGLGDGKTINVVDALGVTMGAVKELAEKVEKIKGKGDGDEKPAARTSARRPVARGIIKRAA